MEWPLPQFEFTEPKMSPKVDIKQVVGSGALEHRPTFL